ncbi:MAG: WXG100 family type VII secretion target [Lapillicoccus sp.]|jgi:uncharacterized protein YukE
MGKNTQQRLGAQKQAADKVLQKRQQFDSDLTRLHGKGSDLQSHYKGQGAAAFFQLLNTWLDDAGKIVGEFDGFANRLVQTDVTTAKSQESQASTFSQAKTTIPTRLG